MVMLPMFLMPLLMTIDGYAVQVRGQLGGVRAEQGCRQLLHNRTGQEVSSNTRVVSLTQDCFWMWKCWGSQRSQAPAALPASSRPTWPEALPPDPAKHLRRWACSLLKWSVSKSFLLAETLPGCKVPGVPDDRRSRLTVQLHQRMVLWLRLCAQPSSQVGASQLVQLKQFVCEI